MSETILISRVRDCLDYSADTGIFTWKLARGTKPAGSAAGSDNGQGYIDISLDGKKYRAHVLAILLIDGRLPMTTVDHINGLRSDNRYSNLRVAGQAINMRNARRYSSNTSGVTGVYWSKTTNNWQAFVYEIDGSRRRRSFESLFDAAAWRKSKESDFGYHANHGRSGQ